MKTVSNGVICMKCQILFSWKSNKNITNLSSAELAQRMVKVKEKYDYKTSKQYVLISYPGPEIIKLFSCSTQLNMKLSLLINMKMLAFSYLSAEKLSCAATFSKKEFAIVSNWRLISRTNVVLGWVEHEKGFITLEPGMAKLAHSSRDTDQTITRHIGLGGSGCGFDPRRVCKILS